MKTQNKNGETRYERKDRLTKSDIDLQRAFDRAGHSAAAISEKERGAGLDQVVRRQLSEVYAEKNRDVTEPAQPEPTAKSKAKETAQHLKNAADKFKAINDILGEKGEIGPEVDPKKWELIRPLLKEAWDEITAAGKSMQEFVSLALENLSPKGRPYFEKFVKEDLTNQPKGSNIGAKEGGVKSEQSVQGEGVAPGSNRPEANLQEVRPGQKEAVPGRAGEGERGQKVQRQSGEPEPSSGGPERTGTQLRRPAGRAGSQEPTGRGQAAADHGVGRRPARSEDRNHVIEPDDNIVPRGVEGKIQANISAIQLLKKLESENRNPTVSEKKTLAKYTGWGAFSQKVFDRKFTDYVNSHKNGVSWADTPEHFFASPAKSY